LLHARCLTTLKVMDHRTLYCQQCGKKYVPRGAGATGLRCCACWGPLGAQYVPDVGAGVDISREFLHMIVAGCKLKKAISSRWDSTLFRAEHLELKVEVLARIFTNEFAKAHPFYIRRLFREAYQASKIRHPNVVGILDVGRVQSCYFIISELVEKGSLRSILDKTEAVDVNQALSLTEDVLRGLSAAHAEGMSHGDLRPQTILLDYDGTAKLCDLAQPTPLKQLNHLFLNEAGVPVGPVYYIAPERVIDDRNADIRSDLYSLGVTLYEMLCGRRPFYGDSALDVMTQRLTQTPVAPAQVNADVPEELSRFVMRLMARDPDDRPATPANALAELKDIAVALSKVKKIKQVTAAMDEEEMQRAQRRRNAFWLATCLVLVAAAIVPFVWLYVDYRKGLNRPPVQELQSGKKPVLILVDADPMHVASRLPPHAVDAVMTLAAYVVATQPDLVAIPPFRMDELASLRPRADALPESVAPYYLLKMTYSPGLDRWKWELSLFRRGQQERAVKVRCAPQGGVEQGFQQIQRALETLLNGDLPGRARPDTAVRPLPLCENSTVWVSLGQALRAERDDLLHEALSHVRQARQACPQMPALAVLEAFYDTLLGWQEDRPPAGEIPPQRQEPPGEFALLAGALRAVRGGDDAGALAALGDYLAEYPRSARAHYLLGMWRLHAKAAPQEALHALRRAVECDPGYLPAAKACVKILHDGDEALLEGFIRQYAHLDPGQGKLEALETYQRTLAGGQRPPVQ